MCGLWMLNVPTLVNAYHLLPLAALILGTLALTLGINLGSEGTGDN
jgi:hypothetical protein